MTVVDKINLTLNGASGAILSKKVDSSNDIQWVVIDTTHRQFLITSHAAHNPAGGESIDVTVVRSKFTLAELGGDIDPDDSRVDVLVDGVAAAANSTNEGEDNDAAHVLVAVGIASTTADTHSSGVHLKLGVSA